jgi:hypothetical protein
MSSTKLVNIVAVTGSTPLDQTYVVAMQFDTASKTLNNIKTSVFSRVRMEAKKVYERHIGLQVGKHEALVGDELGQFCDGDAMRAEFKHILDQAEADYDGVTPDKKAKNTWNKNKTDLSRALTLCYPFIECGEAGSSAIAKWCTDETERREDAADAQALQEQAKKEGKTPLEITKSKTEDVSVKGGDSNNTGADDGAAGSKAVASGTGITFATPEQEAAFNKMIESMAEVSQLDPEAIEGIIAGANNTLALKKTKLLKALGNLQATGT